MVVDYCERWVSRTRGRVKPLVLSVVEQRHLEGLPYTAIISDGDVPGFIVEMAPDNVGVSFLDELQRPYLQCDFELVSSGRLFMTRAIYREYDGSTDEIVEGQTFLFTPKGKQVIIVEDRVQHTSSTQESNDVIMDSNWEVYPTFGNYDAVCREERG